MVTYFRYLEDNASFTLNVYNSNSRIYMLRYLRGQMETCIRRFAEIVSEGHTIDRQDYEFVIEFYADLAIGYISQWMDRGMQLPKEVTTDRILAAMEDSIENLLARFEK
jgi:hypothetical protein